MRTQTSVDNTVNDLHCGIKFENCVKDKKKAILLSERLLFFLEPKYNLFSGTYYFKIPKNLITSTFFAEEDTLKHRYASAKASNAALVKLID